MSKRFLTKLSFLGFRYHGVQIQPNFLTIQERISSELQSKLKRNDFKLRFSSRTDALVSANEIYLLIFFDNECDLAQIKSALKDLPNDIKAHSVVAVSDYYVLQDKIISKEYQYHFVNGTEELDVMLSPYVCHFKEDLDFELMQKAAKYFEGEHYFKNFSFKAKENSIWKRTILSANLNRVESLNNGKIIVPNCSTFTVSSAGFLRGQVRCMMAALVSVGSHEISLEEFKTRLADPQGEAPFWRVPAVGLVLNKTRIVE